MSKTCLNKQCGKTYENPADGFHKDKSRKDGFSPYCKECRCKTFREHWHFKNPKSENFCIDCGFNISHLHSLRLRCDGCKTIFERKRKKIHMRKKRLQDPARARALYKIWRKNNPDKVKKYQELQNIKRKEKRENKIINN